MQIVYFYGISITFLRGIVKEAPHRRIRHIDQIRL